MKSILLSFLFAGSLLAQPAADDPQPAAQPAVDPKEPAAVNSSPPALPDASVDVELSVVSNFVDRGEDVGAGYTQQRRQKHDGFNAPLFFQPSVTFHTPVEGLFFNVFGSFAMRGRTDTDADGRLETGPSGNQTLLADSVNPFVNTTLTAPLSYVRTTLEGVGTHPNVPIANLQFYNFYKEENGLYRRDQVDLTIGYEVITRIGLLGGGIIASNRSAPRGKTNPFADSGANYQATEMYVSYALPFFTDLKFTWYGDVINSDQRLEAEAGHQFEFTETASLSLSLVTGYAYRSGITGWQDLDLGADLSISGFLVGLHAVYRPTLAFFDEDTDLTTNWIQFDGLSNRRDGRVSDPRRVGLAADYINGIATGVVRQQTGNSIYSYTPRQKLPKWINYVKLGYAMSF